jgi:hypothetical protein
VPKANGNHRTGGKGTGGAQIQLEVGAPRFAPEKITFPNGL